MEEKREEALNPNTPLEQLETKAVAFLHLKRETQHFILYYSEVDKSCIDKVSEVLEGNYKNITNRVKQSLEEKLVVEIYPVFHQLHKALGLKDAPEWIRGGVGKGKIMIASPLNPPPGSGFDNVVNTAVHEFVHMIIKKINPRLPRWLEEGIASYEAKDNNEKWIRNTVRKGVEEDTIPSFQDLDTKEDFETFFKRDGYQYSYTIVEFMVNTFGYDSLRTFIKFPDTFEEIFSVTEKELQAQWRTYLKENY